MSAATSLLGVAAALYKIVADAQRHWQSEADDCPGSSQPDAAATCAAQLHDSGAGLLHHQSITPAQEVLLTAYQPLIPVSTGPWLLPQATSSSGATAW